MGNPFGNGSGGTKSPTQAASNTEGPKQKSSDSETAINPKSVPSGGRDAKADPGPATKKSGYIGSGSLSDGSKPFKLGK